VRSELLLRRANKSLYTCAVKKNSTDSFVKADPQLKASSNPSESAEKKPWYRFPLGLFVVFESIKPVIWTTDLDNKFDYFIATPCKANKGLMLYLKKHVFSNLSYITDITYMGVSPWVAATPAIKGLDKASVVGMWSLYLYHSRVRLHLMSTLSNSTTQDSVDSIYKNAN